jgi:hypothetical protein
VAKSPKEEPFSEAHLSSAEYRERLMRKLNCLIAVLEVATAKVRKSMAGSPKDSERLARICANLQSTLEVCIRARLALQRRIAGAGPDPSAPEPVKDVPNPAPGKNAKRASRKRRPRVGSDLADEAERDKFASMPPIDPESIARCDLEDLGRRLIS